LGNQFFVGSEHHLMRGVTYGTFAPRHDDQRFPRTAKLTRDLADIAAAGFNTIRTYTAPPDDVVLAAADHGLRTFAGVHTRDWRYLVGLSRREQRRASEDDVRLVRETARRLKDRPEIAALCIGNEIPADVVRWFGAKEVAGSISRLVDAVKDEDPARLVTYANYPTAEYLSIPDLDFITFNVFLEDSGALRDYLTHLHHTTHDRPLVLGEFGRHVDEHPDGERHQAQLLDRQYEVALDRGVAGLFAFSWTDEWYVGDSPVDDWKFGLTRTDRSPRPALKVASRWNNRVVADLREDWPRISVVVCARNEQATLAECLQHATALDYPDFEVIVVDDGSTDRTAEIAKSFSDVRLFSVPHGGLSVARNVGIEMATGEIVAYLDADAYPTRQWLRYLYLAFDGSDVGGAGGPNLSPPSDRRACQHVAQAPGGPAHVLLSDDRAEHIPGCNMAFWRSVLVDIGGFDPIYRAAGDDVDVCWKVLDRGWGIAFHPAAVVWHHRRGSIRAYLRQQRGYGRAEALVAARHPDRFGRLRTPKWRGRIYAPERRFHPGQRIYRGAFGSAPYQSIYHREAFAIDWVHQVGIPALLMGLMAALPIAVEWAPMRWGAAAVVTALFAIFMYDVAHAGSGRRFRSISSRLCVAALHMMQPVARWWGKTRSWQIAQREAPREKMAEQLVHAPGAVMVISSQKPRHEIARSMLSALRAAGYEVTSTTGWEDHDGTVNGSILTEGELITSEHPPGTVQARVRTRLRRRRLAGALAVAALTAALHAPIVAIAIVWCVGTDLLVGSWRLGPRRRSKVLT
jgi:glycosyltransferase involved in cell wall biosynthesis